MADSDVDVDFYIDHVKVVLEGATMEALKALAYRIVERAQLNIRDNDQIDTGFMVNSIYPVWKDGSDYDRAQAAAGQKTRSARTGKQVSHEQDFAPEPGMPEDADAGVVVGASYAIYQEVLKPFLYPAAEKAAAEFGATAEEIYRQALPNEGPGPK